MGYVRLGVITRVLGLNGELVCSLDFWEVPKISIPCKALIGYTEGFSKQVEVTKCRYTNSEIVLSLNGVSSLQTAKELVEQALFIESWAVNYQNIFANPDIIGYEVFDENSVRLGKLVQIVQSPAHPIWVIESKEEEDKSLMLPAVSQFVVDLDSAEKKVIVRLIEGLEFE